MGDYEETLRYLFGLKRLGTRPGPEVTVAILHELGDPHRSFRSIHITGSKGKGSVAALCASVLAASGLKTGLYTSPHLFSYRERARVNGEVATREDVVEGIARVRKALTAVEKKGLVDREATYFEITTAWAFDLFRRKGVEAAAIEVGLGGRLDSTNVLQAPVTVVTTLELEHTELLGPTIEDIAREKAGIFHRGAWGVSGVEEGQGLDELRRHAFRAGVPLWELGREVKVQEREPFLRDRLPWQRLTVETPAGRRSGLEVPLAGPFQAKNVATAVAALELFARAQGRPITDAAFRGGLAATDWPARMEMVGSRPPFYVDAAHTPGSAREVLAAIRELHPDWDPEASVLLFSCLGDKRTGEILLELAPLARELITFSLGSERGMPGRDIARAARATYPKILVAPTAAEAVKLAKVAVGPRGVLVATGGVYLAAAVLSEVRGIPVDGPDLSDPVRPASGEEKPRTASPGPAVVLAAAEKRPRARPGRGKVSPP